MAYPKPKYTARINVGSIEIKGTPLDSDPEKFKLAALSIADYLSENAYHFHGSSERVGTYRKSSFLTPDSIVVHVVGNYSNDLDKNPEDLAVFFRSFLTPVSDLESRLIEEVKKAFG